MTLIPDYYLQFIGYVKASEKTPPALDLLNLSSSLGLKLKNDTTHDLQAIYSGLHPRTCLFKGIEVDCVS